MEYVNYFVIAILIIIIIQRFLPTKGVRNISTTDLIKELKETNKHYIDVRTPREFRGNHIQGFQNIPLQQLLQQANKDLSKEKEVLVICQSGMRSQRACKMLKKVGFTKVTNIKGGMNAWV